MFGHILALAWLAPGTPCFPGSPPLVAIDVWKQLEKHAWSAYAEVGTPPLRSTFGTCNVEQNRVSAADGTLVVELGCAARVLVPGIVDDLGIQVGALGRDVIERKPDRSLSCMANGPDHVRCSFGEFDPDAGEHLPSWYVVAGTLGDSDTLGGVAAVRFFAPRRIVELQVTIDCH